LMYDPSPGGIAEAKTGISGSRSCTNIQTGVFAYEDIWNGINLTDRPIPRGYRRPGRRPHVPSSKTDNVKEPTRILPRFDWFRASAIPTKKRHETNARPVAEPRPLAGGAYMCGAQRRQPGILQLYCSFPTAWDRSRAPGATLPATLKIGTRPLFSRP
jgi:hypothetical protein